MGGASRSGTVQPSALRLELGLRKMTLQSMVFEPSNRVIYLAVGKNAPRNTFGRIDLKEYFAGDRSVAVAD